MRETKQMPETLLQLLSNLTSVVCRNLSQDLVLIWALVAHTCNLSYSGGRNQEDRVQSKPGHIVHEILARKTHHSKGLVTQVYPTKK
jgi:hypothetical protein